MSELLPDTSETLNASPKELLENTCWAPWLRFDDIQLVGQKKIFPEGQLDIVNGSGNLEAFLSTNRIEWDGDKEGLPTWDEVAGPTATYAETFKSTGNTVVLMSMSVDPSRRGSGLPTLLVDRLKHFARTEHIEHLIGPFRPSDYGKYKRENGDFNFTNYCDLRREDGLRKDSWLRAVQRMGMKSLKPDARSMVVPADSNTLDHYRNSYKPEAWWRVEDPVQIDYLISWHQPNRELESVDEVWECGEAGTWYVDRKNDQTVYIESNLWGEIPVRQDRYDLSPEEIQLEESKLVERIKTQVEDKEGVWGVWISPHSSTANMVRTWETHYFPELPEVVNDHAENSSLFYVLVDTRDSSDRVIHAARITGNGSVESDFSGTPFAGINELIQSGAFSAGEFYDYYQKQGVDISKCIAVETNFRVGGKVERLNGLSGAELAYLSFFRLVAKSRPGVNQGGVFASINRASLISFRRVGLEYESLLGREELQYPAPDGKGFYMPVFLPYRKRNIELFDAIERLAPPELRLNL